MKCKIEQIPTEIAKTETGISFEFSISFLYIAAVSEWSTCGKCALGASEEGNQIRDHESS